MTPKMMRPHPVLMWPASRAKMPPATTIIAPIHRAIPIIFFLLICPSLAGKLKDAHYYYFTVDYFYIDAKRANRDAQRRRHLDRRIRSAADGMNAGQQLVR